MQEEKVERAQASHDTAGEQQNEDAQEETAGVNDQDEVTCLNVFVQRPSSSYYCCCFCYHHDLLLLLLLLLML